MTPLRPRILGRLVTTAVTAAREQAAAAAATAAAAEAAAKQQQQQQQQVATTPDDAAATSVGERRSHPISESPSTLHPSHQRFSKQVPPACGQTKPGSQQQWLPHECVLGTDAHDVQASLPAIGQSSCCSCACCGPSATANVACKASGAMSFACTDDVCIELPR
eukprot:CAMPEP_0172870378 /NCGR_PEP_ID=MMETSP1075-20121228/91492_1 /TAXON_ID=2916 /ORGANISM="Ceratium fusus, Strain PA161109" /LENGTH=163 /DNA_ID=CAMNT_0013720511 /DNA_START=54 /DNA_END=545 /DNA_ORIENTATION=+